MYCIIILLYVIVTFSSESEELAWDPLVDSYEEMVIAQHGLVTLAPLNFEPLELGGWDIEELFEKDEYVELKNKDEGELPLDRGEMMEATKKKRKVMEVFESDIPSIRLQSGMNTLSCMFCSYEPWIWHS